MQVIRWVSVGTTHLSSQDVIQLDLVNQDSPNRAILNRRFPDLLNRAFRFMVRHPMQTMVLSHLVDTTNQDSSNQDMVNQDSAPILHRPLVDAYNRAILNRHIRDPLNRAFRFMVRHPMQTMVLSHSVDTTNQDSFNQDMVNQDSAPILHRPLVDAYNRAILNRRFPDLLNRAFRFMVRHPMQTMVLSHSVDTTNQDSSNQDTVNQEPLNQVFLFMVLSSSLAVDH